MCNSHTVTSIVIGTVFLAISLSVTLPLIFRTDDGLDLIVYCKGGESVVVSPRPDEFEISDELWEEPRYKSNRVEFANGIIEIKKTGVYSLKSVTSFYVENESENLVLGTAFGRVIQGDIVDRFTYTTKSVLGTDASSVSLSEYDLDYENVKPLTHHTLSNIIDFEITEEDIRQGNNKVAPQYVFNHFAYDDADLYKDINIGRDTHTVKTSLSLSKIQNKIGSSEIKV